MVHRPHRLLSLLIVAALLQACQPKPEAAPTATAAMPGSAPAGAADDSPAALMAQAFDSGTAKAPFAADVPADKPEQGQQSHVLVMPALVVPLDADHRVLVVTGTPPEAGHISEGNIGLYGFERRGNRWVKTAERPSLAWTGFDGHVGTLKAHALGAGRHALSIENGSCWQGMCGQWLQVYALGFGDAQLIANAMTASTALGATAGCEEFLKGQPLPADQTMPITPDRCFDVQGRWQFEKAPENGWPDLVVTFSGHETTEDEKTHQVTARPVDERWVLRHDGARYQPLQGRNPTQGF